MNSDSEVLIGRGTHTSLLDHQCDLLIRWLLVKSEHLAFNHKNCLGNKNYYAMLLPLLDMMRSWIALGAAGHIFTNRYAFTKQGDVYVFLFQDAEEAIKIAGEIGKNHSNGDIL